MQRKGENEKKNDELEARAHAPERKRRARVEEREEDDDKKKKGGWMDGGDGNVVKSFRSI